VGPEPGLEVLKILPLVEAQQLEKGGRHGIQAEKGTAIRDIIGDVIDQDGRALLTVAIIAK
jgi:hypothetical protein